MLQASLNTQFKKPVTPIPGVFRVEIWSEGIDGRRITGEQHPCPVNSYLPGFLAHSGLCSLTHFGRAVAVRGELQDEEGTVLAIGEAVGSNINAPRTPRL